MKKNWRSEIKVRIKKKVYLFLTTFLPFSHSPFVILSTYPGKEEQQNTGVPNCLGFFTVSLFRPFFRKLPKTSEFVCTTPEFS